MATWSRLGDHDGFWASLDELNRRYQDAVPVVQDRLVRSFERGPVGEWAKEVSGRVCQICQVLGLPARGFTMPDGRHYVEAHHVSAVSTLNRGVLSLDNIVILCPNHHRELHHGRAWAESERDFSAFMCKTVWR
jgi:hypothetical protein